MQETPEARLKRMRMRAGRRGIKEMDLILGGYAEARLAAMDAEALDLFDALLWENDHDLYAWVTGKAAVPDSYAGLIGDIAVQSGAV
ncbi:succinate dehydrogenase assembly factor 2 [Pseudoruegeria sp. HB172150]|uniref:FAD assembly factor SdhE n=1 Tax=Pseudoruegeria sp. HB172150 TaxID=2721164 RepID=UPI001551AF6F|nr:succinate dehydrogenase assembly factor 2 [Pseudoruegeria sp. HB172150]